MDHSPRQNWIWKGTWSVCSDAVTGFGIFASSQDYLTEIPLEINTKAAPQGLSRYGQIVRWWRDEGSKLVTFGSDAHDPTAIAHGFAEAVALVESHGFRPGHHPYDLWTRPG